MNSKHVIVMIALSVLPFGTAKCKTQEAKVATDLAVKIADDVCTEIESVGITNDFIALLCTGIDAVSKVKVIMPRTEWHAIRARRVGIDAGPGK